MNKNAQKNTAEDFAAENEGTITPVQLLQEVEPLLKEYFIGNFKIENNSLKMEFKNGQAFKMAIAEIN